MNVPQFYQKVDRTFRPQKSPPQKSPTLPHKSAVRFNPRLIAKVLSRGLKSKLNKHSSICHPNKVFVTILQWVSTDFSYETGVSTGGLADKQTTPRTNKRPPGQTIRPPGQTIGPTNKGYIPVVLHILSPKCENPYKKLGPKQMCLTDRKLMDRTIQNPKSP